MCHYHPEPKGGKSGEDNQSQLERGQAVTTLSNCSKPSLVWMLVAGRLSNQQIQCSQKNGNFNEQPSFSTLACMQGPWQNIWLESSCSASYILLSVLLYATCYALSSALLFMCSTMLLLLLLYILTLHNVHKSHWGCCASFSPQLLCWQKLDATFFHIVSTFNTGAALTIWCRAYDTFLSYFSFALCTQCTQIQMLTT